MTAGIVLAGGAARRFGGDKLAAPFEGRPVLHRAIGAVAAVADPIVVVLAPGAPVPTLPPELAHRLHVARDALEHQGPLAGLHAGLAALPPGCPVAIAVAGDMPALVPEVLGLLVAVLAADASLAWVQLEADPPAPLPAAVRPSVVLAAAAGALGAGRRSLRALGGLVPSRVLAADTWRVLDPAGATLRDVDRPEDLPRG